MPSSPSFPTANSRAKPAAARLHKGTVSSHPLTLVLPKKSSHRRSIFARMFRIACFIAIVLGLGIGAYLCLRPNSNLRGIPWLPAGLERWADYHGRIRNLPAFAVLALPFMCVCNGRRARRKAIAWLAGFVTVTELAQHFIPGRWCEWQDIVSGCAGLLITWSVFELSFWGSWRVRCILKRRRQSAATAARKSVGNSGRTDQPLKQDAGK